MNKLAASKYIVSIALAVPLLSGCNQPPKGSNSTPSPFQFAARPQPFARTIALSPGIAFVDVAAEAGLKYEWKAEGARPLNILQTIGNGCAFLDYNNDGNLDILLIGPKLALFEGDGKGHFTDVTVKAGLDKISGHLLGVAIGDFDNDGFDDLYLTAYRGGILLKNMEGKSFKDVTKESGIPAQPWGTSASFVDIDGDGKLDLYIGNYAQFGPDTKPQLCEMGGRMSSCGPRFYLGESGRLYRNLNGKQFRDITNEWKAGNPKGKTLGVVATNADGSGKASLALANDEEAGNFLRNLGRKFDDIGASTGFAFQSSGQVQGGMGIDSGDFDNDGKLDLTVATFQHEPKAVYHNETTDKNFPVFTECSSQLGMSDSAAPFVAFGVKFFDFNNDGYLDLIFANGHVQDNIELIDKTTSYRQPLQLFRNDSGKRFTEVNGGAPFQKMIVGRGLSVGDFDNDGKMDILVVDSEGAPLLLHNACESGAGAWIGFKLIGSGKSSKDAYGAEITITTERGKLMRVCHADGSYLSSSDSRVHFGLGTGKIRSVSVRWPDGKIQKIGTFEPGRYNTVKEEK